MISAVRTAPAVIAAFGVPLLLWLAWTPREAPADWPCEMVEPPPGQLAAIDAYRDGLAGAAGFAAALLLGLAVRLSQDRRRAAGLVPRTGGPTVVAVALAAIATVRVVIDLDLLADAGLGALFALVLLALPALIWIVVQAPGAKAAAAAQMSAWLSLLVVVLVACVIANEGLRVCPIYD